ncbi:MAG: DUF4168 domain-containing protein [Nostocales cyanobacterium]|nr:MAG: DUF4168 domain-containing protein [Nostocales cyanobacterium]TAF12876.1 MAG: DUF4168 domain-containing protein [Nostocales cyanobacterium]
MQENYLVYLGSVIERQLSKSLLLTTLTGVSFILGTLSWGAMANNTPTAPVTNAEITNYAKSVLEMEPKRQEAFGEIKKLIGGNEIPKIVCNDSKSMASLPTTAKSVAVKYCNESQQVVESNSLSIERFNEITLETQTNDKLKRQIYNTLIRLQNESTAKAGARNKQ